VDVRVLEPGHQQPARQVDDLRTRPALLADVLVAPGCDDPAVSDRDGLHTRSRRVDGVDTAAEERQLGGPRHQPRSRVPAGS
jgi:hypothetical protein